jgi:uncharacterized OB-fold protein
MTDIDRSQLPSPGWTPEAVGYWKAAAKSQLVVQQCTNCSTHRAPPTWACYHCQSTDWQWDELPGTGKVFTYTWADQRANPDTPLYNISVIELDGTTGEPVRLMTQVINTTKTTLQVGLSVTVTFEPYDHETAVPLFAPTTP